MQELTIEPNTGRAFSVLRGQHLRVYATSIVDFLAFDLHDLHIRFDQSRTKTYNCTVFVSKGHSLMSKSLVPLLTITEDHYKGTHDLQKSMCSGTIFQNAADEGRTKEYWNREIPRDELPDHGCWENLSGALEPYGIAPQDVPSPLNIFQNMRIEPDGGLWNTTIRGEPGDFVEFRAERDVLVAISACPDVTIGGRSVRCVLMEPAEVGSMNGEPTAAS